MMGKIIGFLRIAAPFLAVVFLWRLSAPVWNPAGMLALIPIFYCTFIRPVPWFVLFAAVFCFLIDYKSDMVLFWTSCYCLCYAVFGFQTVIDFSHTADRGWRMFMVFLGVPLLLCVCANFGFYNLLKTIWLWLLSVALYMPITALLERTYDDR